MRKTDSLTWLSAAADLREVVLELADSAEAVLAEGLVAADSLGAADNVRL